MMSFDDYLLDLGVVKSELSTERLDALQIEYNRYYKRIHQRERRKNFHQLNVLFLHLEYDFLLACAERYGLPVSRLVHDCALAQLRKEYVVLNQDRIRGLEMDQKRIGNTVNQVIKRSHLFDHIDQRTVMEIKSLLLELEEVLRDGLRNPDDLESLVEQALQRNPAFLPVFKSIIQRYDTEG